MGKDSTDRFDEREECACREAVRHVAEGWAEWVGIPSPSWVASALAPSGKGISYAAFVLAAERLCTLESLAHRTAEVEAELRTALSAFDASLPALVATLPARFPRASLRTFAGLAAAQREWIEETGWLDVDSPSQGAWIPESPSRSWRCFGAGVAESSAGTT